MAAAYSRKRGPEALYLYGPRDPGAFRADGAKLYGESTIVVFTSSLPHKSLLFIYFSCPGEMSWQQGGGKFACLPAGKASVHCVCVCVRELVHQSHEVSMLRRSLRRMNALVPRGHA